MPAEPIELKDPRIASFIKEATTTNTKELVKIPDRPGRMQTLNKLEGNLYRSLKKEFPDLADNRCKAIALYITNKQERSLRAAVGKEELYGSPDEKEKSKPKESSEQINLIYGVGILIFIAAITSWIFWEAFVRVS